MHMPINLQYYSMYSTYPSSTGGHIYALRCARCLSMVASITGCSMMCQAFGRCCRNLPDVERSHAAAAKTYLLNQTECFLHCVSRMDPDIFNCNL